MQLAFSVMNFSHQLRVLQDGLVPVYRYPQQNWIKIQGSIYKLSAGEEGIQFSFAHSFGAEYVQIAFCFPWSLPENQALLQQVLKKARQCPDLYVHKSLLCYSREGQQVPLVTVSSTRAKQRDREVMQNEEVFPLGDGPHRFGTSKACVVISARVHPGQTPSSHVMNGILKELVEQTAAMQALLNRFVFYLVPVVNPDGVARGHYRLDSKGVNLNRCYISPKPKEHGAVYAVKQLILNLHRQDRFFAYLDLHAHAGRKGCFIYGNYSPSLSLQTQICLFPRLLALRNPDFDYEGSNFTEGNMYSKDKADSVSKEATGRVTIFKKTKNPRCWTLECSFVMSQQQNIINSKNNPFAEGPLQASKLATFINPAKKPGRGFYTIQSYQNLGRDILHAFLQLQEIHPESYLPHSPFGNLNNLKVYTAAMLLRMVPFRYEGSLRRTLKLLDCNPEKALESLRELISQDRTMNESTISSMTRKVSTRSTKKSNLNTESSSPQKGKQSFLYQVTSDKFNADKERKKIFVESLILTTRIKNLTAAENKRCTIVNLAIDGQSRAVHAHSKNKYSKQRVYRGLSSLERQR